MRFPASLPIRDRDFGPAAEVPAIFFILGVFLTPAIQILKNLQVSHRVAEYEHLEKGAAFASRAIGVPLEKTIKTLVIELVPGGHCIVLMPGEKKISFKKLAKIRKAKRAAMVDIHTAEKLSGYRVGGISPFGFKNPLPVMMEHDLMEYDEVAINGGKRGVMLLMRPEDIVGVLDAEIVRL